MNSKDKKNLKINNFHSEKTTTECETGEVGKQVEMEL